MFVYIVIMINYVRLIQFSIIGNPWLTKNDYKPLVDEQIIHDRLQTEMVVSNSERQTWTKMIAFHHLNYHWIWNHPCKIIVNSFNSMPTPPVRCAWLHRVDSGNSSAHISDVRHRGTRFFGLHGHHQPWPSSTIKHQSSTAYEKNHALEAYPSSNSPPLAVHHGAESVTKAQTLSEEEEKTWLVGAAWSRQLARIKV